jgi:hypothetical protein
MVGLSAGFAAPGLWFRGASGRPPGGSGSGRRGARARLPWPLPLLVPPGSLFFLVACLSGSLFFPLVVPPFCPPFAPLLPLVGLAFFLVLGYNVFVVGGVSFPPGGFFPPSGFLVPGFCARWLARFRGWLSSFGRVLSRFAPLVFVRSVVFVGSAPAPVGALVGFWWCVVSGSSSSSRGPLGAAPPVRSVAWRAFRSGSLWGLRVRSSSRSFSFFVLVAAFSCPRAAARFARAVAPVVGVSVAVRRSVSAVPLSGAPRGLWLVSVPVAVPAPVLSVGFSGFACRLPVGRPGGFRPLASGLAVGLSAGGFAPPSA